MRDINDHFNIYSIPNNPKLVVGTPISDTEIAYINLDPTDQRILITTHFTQQPNLILTHYKPDNNPILFTKSINYKGEFLTHITKHYEIIGGTTSNKPTYTSTKTKYFSKQNFNSSLSLQIPEFFTIIPKEQNNPNRKWIKTNLNHIEVIIQNLNTPLIYDKFNTPITPITFIAIAFNPLNANTYLITEHNTAFVTSHNSISCIGTIINDMGPVIYVT